MSAIDPRAAVDPQASLAEGVEVGPFSVIGPEVTIGAGTWVGPHVVIEGKVTIGSHNKIYPHSCLGYPPQDLKYKGEPTELRIGDGNVFREATTIHRGTKHGGGLTRIGDRGYFMVGTHIAHDCLIGDGVLFANAGTLAGHVEIGDGAVVGAYSGVHQFCRVGKAAYIGGYSVVTQDAMPYCLTVGNRARCFGLNKIGLRRSGMAASTIEALDRVVKEVFSQRHSRREGLAKAEAEYGHVREVQLLLEFIRSAKRGVAAVRFGQIGAED